MRQAYQTPCATDLLQTTQQEATEPTDFFELTKHRFHDDLAPGVSCLACRRPHFRGHPLLRRGRCVARLGLRGMVRLAPRGPGGITPSVLQCLCGCLTVIAVIQRRRDGVGLARLVLGGLNTGLGQGGERGVGHRHGLLFVVRRIGHVTGQDDLTRPVHTGWRIATVLPAFVMGWQDRQLGVGDIGLRFVLRGLFHRLGRFASALRACPLALRFGGGSLLALRLGFRFGLDLSPWQSGFNRGQALLTARQLSGSLLASTAPQHRVFRFVLLIRRRD